VQGFGPAEYTERTHTYMWLTTAVEDIALEIACSKARIRNVTGRLADAVAKRLLATLGCGVPAATSRGDPRASHFD
jgi:hypothetical protein